MVFSATYQSYLVYQLRLQMTLLPFLSTSLAAPYLFLAPLVSTGSFSTRPRSTNWESGMHFHFLKFTDKSVTLKKKEVALQFDKERAVGWIRFSLCDIHVETKWLLPQFGSGA